MARTHPIGADGGAVRPRFRPGGAERAPEAAVGSVSDHHIVGANRDFTFSVEVVQVVKARSEEDARYEADSDFDSSTFDFSDLTFDQTDQTIERGDRS